MKVKISPYVFIVSKSPPPTQTLFLALKDLPTRLEKDKLKEFSQLDRR